MLEKMFAQFLREKEYLGNLSPQTIRNFRWIHNRWRDLIGQISDKANINDRNYFNFIFLLIFRTIILIWVVFY